MERISRDEWFKKELVAERVWAVSDGGISWIYLIEGSKAALLVDTGWGRGDLPAFVGGITSLPLMVVNTHGHPDHLSGNYQFPEVYINEEDLPLLEKAFGRDSRESILQKAILSLPAGYDTDSWLNARPGKTVAIRAPYTFDLGDRKIEVVSIPGHSPGSIALLDRSAGLLFPGDTVIQGEIWLHVDDAQPVEVYLQSLCKLKMMKDEFHSIFPSHAQTPVDLSVLDELIQGALDIASGRATGIPYATFAGDGLRCTFDRCRIVYRKDRIHQYPDME